MVARTVRAAALGTLATGATAALTWWLLQGAVASWPGTGAVEVGSALGFIATGVAGVVAGWATLLLAMATASLVAEVGPHRAERSPAPAPAGPAERGLTARLAAGLLVAASMGLTPATAVGATGSSMVSAVATRGATGEAAGPTWEDVTVEASEGAASPGPQTSSGQGAPHKAPGQVSHDADEVPLPGWTPTVPDAEPVRLAPGEVSLVSTTTTSQPEDEVVVHRGDTLWDIAARHLGEHATDQDVAEAWPRWFAANRDVIGDDPDLIHPGQRLVVPAHGGAR